MKTAVVTGGTAGLGRALVLAFARSGVHPVALFSRNEQAAEQLKKILSDERLAGTVLQKDISQPSIVESLKEIPAVVQASELVLVNNASAAFSPQPLHLVSVEALDALIATNLRGSFLCVQALLRALVRTRGTVVNILSTVVHDPPPKGFAPYVMAKHGLLGLTRAIASEYGERGIKAISVSPGYMETSFTAGWDERLRTAMPPASLPEAVADFVVHLLAEGRIAGGGENYSLPSVEA